MNNSLFTIEAACDDGDFPAVQIWSQVTAPLLSVHRSVLSRFSNSGLSFTLRLQNQRASRVCVELDTGTIWVSRGTLALLWVCSYLNLVYWETRCSLGAIGNRVTIDPHEHHRLFEAMKLLDWGLNHAHARSGQDQWPDDLPQPRGVDDCPTSRTATQITLRALGFIL